MRNRKVANAADEYYVKNFHRTKTAEEVSEAINLNLESVEALYQEYAKTDVDRVHIGDVQVLTEERAQLNSEMQPTPRISNNNSVHRFNAK